jgi:hypothetical protein
MTDPFDNLLAVATKQPIGVAVLCHTAKAADQLKRLLYVRRAKAQERGVTDYNVLSISFSPHAGDILYLYKRTDGEAVSDE